MVSNREDNDSRFALGVAFILIAVILVSLLASMVYKSTYSITKTASTISASEVASESNAQKVASSASESVSNKQVISAVTDSPSVVIVDGVVKFYFSSGSAQLASGANDALSEVVKAVRNGKKLTISGYHDATGNPASNAELAKQRANSVVAALVELGVSQDKLELKKPESALADGPAAEARRVEVTVQ